ncbi:MAG TPA: glutathione S-transferase family protein [Polyangiales bacterium]
MGRHQLFGMMVSPWTHRALWALDFCGIPYRFKNYVPGLGELMLRLRTRNFFAAVEVPVLLADGRVISGSGAIARYAAEVAGDERLGDFAVTADWERRSDAAASEGRDGALRRVLASRDAQIEAGEGVVPALLRPHMTWLARRVFRSLTRKYAALGPPGAMRELLTHARAQLRGGSYLLERFSYADIVVASSLEMVEPLVPRGPASYQAYRWPELADEFADLIGWRRALIAQHWPAFTAHAPGALDA